eukprot:TRINITY_DN4082_c0_g1_i3.p1 TRINITY_DN4082_c0_g1~~TRINITY_DN4082_c0_g1_i3.p1  ORF type:complete len:533 (+),score=100.64 TRINITY_DN4082_c0_g1_i3:448-2046(+)
MDRPDQPDQPSTSIVPDKVPSSEIVTEEDIDEWTKPDDPENQLIQSTSESLNNVQDKGDNLNNIKAENNIQKEEEVVGVQEGGNDQGQGWGFGLFAKTVLQDTRQLGDSLSQAFTGIVQFGEDKETSEKAGSSSGVDGEDDIDFDAELKRLEGKDNNLQIGLKAIDEQVENLADGAVKALGSLWGGVSGAVKGGIRKGQQIADTTLKELRPMEKVKMAQEYSSKIITQAEKGLEEMGKQMLADMVTGDDELETQQTNQQTEGTTVNFESCFYVFGGQQYYEELESLSNECARLCNRSRQKMTEQEKKELESNITEIGKVFDLEQHLEGESVTQPSCNGDFQLGQPLMHAYEPLAHLCKKSVEKAKDLYEVLSKEQNSQQSEIQEESTINKGAEYLIQIQEKGVKLLSELCSAGVDRLLNLGKSVNARFRLNEPLNDGIQWPEDSILLANLLRGQIKQLLADSGAVASAFIKSLTNSGNFLEQAEQAQLLASNLDVDRDVAAQKLRDCFRNLMFVVLVKDIPLKVGNDTSSEN